jgi:hypothetical protein
MCWEGKDIIKQGRQMLGETQPLVGSLCYWNIIVIDDILWAQQNTDVSLL